jgi:hypothetical protein
MPLIAPDNGGTLNAAGLQALPFQDPNNFIATPQKILAAAQATGQLGQLSDQLALEKAERQADMAGTQYRLQATNYLKDNLPLMNQAQISDTLAKIASTKTAAQQSANDFSTAQTYANTGAPASAGLAQAQITSNALAGAQADFNSGFAFEPGYLKTATSNSAAAAGNTLGGFGEIVTPNPPPAGALSPGASIQTGSGALSTADTPIVTTNHGNAPGAAPGATPQKSIVTVPQGASAPADASPFVTQAGPGYSLSSVNPALTGMMQGLRNAAYIDATTDAKTVEMPNTPEPGQTSTVFQRISKADGSVVSQSAPVVTKNDATRLVQRSAQDIVNLQTSNNLLGGVQTALDKWKSTYPSPTGFLSAIGGEGQRQAQYAAAAAAPAGGKVSLIEKSIGGMAESPETRNLVGAMQVYNQSLIKLDPDTQKGANAIGLSVGDIAAPDQLQTKLNGAKDYAAARLKTFADDNISTRINPGQPAPGAQTTPATPGATTQPAIAAQPEGAPMVYKGQKGVIKTINGQQYFVPTP